MKLPHPRFSLRRMMVAVAIMAGAAFAFRSLGRLQPAPPAMAADIMMLTVPSPIGPDGRGGTYTRAEWESLIARMSSPKVLDAALTDARVARLTGIAKAPSPRAALASLYGIGVSFSLVETDDHPAINGVTLHVGLPGGRGLAIYDLTNAIAEAIAAHGPEGVAVAGRPTGISHATAALPIPWHHDPWVYGILATTTIAIVVVISWPPGSFPHCRRGTALRDPMLKVSCESPESE
jgi:hypothetical protein